MQEQGHPARGALFAGLFDEPESDARDRKALRSLRRNSELAFAPPFSRQRRMLDTLRRRRQEIGCAEFAMLGPGSPPDVLITIRELLLRREDWNDGVSTMLEPAGWTERPVGCDELESRLVRLVHDDISAEEVDDLARSLRMQGVRASVSHLTPLAPVGKALGGAEPAQSLPLPKVARKKAAGRGRRIRVGVVDSGISTDDRGDGWLDGIARDEENIEEVKGLRGYLTRAAGHGTFISGIIRRIAPDARIDVFKAQLDDGLSSEIDVACELIRAVKADPDDPIRVLNLSFGSPTVDDLPPLALEAALEVIDEYEADRAPEDRVLMIAAAGNYGDSRPVWPGAFRRVFAVAGLDDYLEPAPWSSRGFWVDAACVGEAIRSTYVVGTESPEFDPDDPDTFEPPAPWALWTGSSFAAPQLVGAIARLCDEDPGLTPRRALEKILADGHRVPGFGTAVRILSSAQW